MELVSEKEIAAAVNRTVEAYKLERTPEKIASEVMAKLTSSEDQILAKLLGMENKWGKWNIDNCHGRKSAISGHIEERMHDVLQVWLEQLGIKPNYIPPMSAKLKQEMKTAYKCEYEQHLRRSIRLLAQQAAAAKAKEIIDKLLETPEPFLDDERP